MCFGEHVRVFVQLKSGLESRMAKLVDCVELWSANGSCSILAVVLTTTLDAREVKFLLGQIDDYIQVTEFMLRKTPALDQGIGVAGPALSA
jgi:hypothetical protein